MNELRILAKAKAFGYIALCIYMIGFLLLILEHYILFFALGIIVLVFIAFKVVYDMLFIMKTLRGEKK